MEGELLICFLLSLAVCVRCQALQEFYDYCDAQLKLCEVPTDHTMCKYPVPGLSPKCTPLHVHESLSATEKKRILFWHNKFRSNIANGTERHRNKKLPTSSNMRQIYWDKELEAIAMRWAEQCVSATNPKMHDKCRNTKRFQVSQNVGVRIANGTSIDKQAPQIVIAWFKENKDFDQALVDNFTRAAEEKVSAQQFANIIWADSYALGCARVVFQEKPPAADKSIPMWTVERLVCNYGPGGNQVGKSVYKRGISCASCPEGTQCSLTYPGLCAIANEEKIDGQQNIDNQDGKQDVSLTADVTVFSKTSEPKLHEEEQKLFPANDEFPEDREEGEEEEEMKEEDEGMIKDCQGDECIQEDSPLATSPRSGNHFDIFRAPKPTARKKWHGIRKWRVSRGGKAVRDVGKYNDLNGVKNGDRCNCYVLVTSEDAGSLPDFSLSLLCLSATISVLNWFLCNCNKYT